MKTVLVEHEYSFPAARIWALATDYGALSEVMKGLVTFEGLPQGRTVTGQNITVMVSLFGRLPNQPYAMEILDCDDAQMILRSSERGAGVKSWKHTLSVVATEMGCQLTDHIEIDAGLLTPLMAAWARYMYRARHKRRLEMLSSGAY